MNARSLVLSFFVIVLLVGAFYLIGLPRPA